MSNKINRLYDSLHPLRYELDLSLNSKAATFEGILNLTFIKVKRPSKRITLHLKDLNVLSATLVKKEKNSDRTINIVRINIQKTYDELRLHCDELLFPGEYLLKLSYSGKINEQMNGIYPSYFKNKKKSEIIIATQFESHHAREAFPCIDEPEAKAVFSLTLHTDPVSAVISNTEIKKQHSKGPGKLTTIFNDTPKMSTYLLAFVVGNLDYTEKINDNKIKVRVYATPDKLQATKFALDTACRVLSFYQEYFGIAYPLSKCDFIALPDFASGAMENWGCITFREQALLADPKDSSMRATQYVANVIAHELTHQWFGNLVTMKWWTDLWLNESFASWMSYLAVDKLFPEWKVWDQFIVDEQAMALNRDSLKNTHPIEVKINHPDEIRTIFDDISYEKGASVITMLENFMGSTNFQAGIRAYLKKYSYSNSDTKDLYSVLEEVSGLPVPSFMTSWTSQSGYPILKIDTNAKQLIFKQQRFLLDDSVEDKTLWPIPILGSLHGMSDKLLIKDTSLFTAPKDLKHLKINTDRRGFYRTHYSPDLSKLIFSDISFLNDVERFGLLNDYLEFTKASLISSVDLLELLNSFVNEQSLIVWDAIVSIIGSIRLAMDDDDMRMLLGPLIKKLATDKYKLLGISEKKNESSLDIMLRPMIVSLLDSADYPEIVDWANESFKKDPTLSNISSNLRLTVLCSIAYRGDKTDYDKLLDLYQNETRSELKNNYCIALNTFQDVNLISNNLEYIKTKHVRKQDYALWISRSFSNRKAKSISWKWLQANWDWLQSEIGTDLSFYRMPIYVARVFSDVKFIKEFENFFNEHSSPSMERSIKQGVENIKWQAKWKKADLINLKSYLKKNYF